MKVIRFISDGKPIYGAIDGEQVAELDGTPFDRPNVTARSHPLTGLQLLAPCTPTKVLAAAVNYRDHSIEEHRLPKKPELFIKLPSSIIGPDQPILLPKNAGRVDAEGELVVVIGKRGKSISVEEALSYVLGYTCGNDVSAREWQRNDTQWWRAKSSDTFTAVGPIIVSGLDPSNLELRVRINGKEIQATNTSRLVFDVPTLISFASRAITLEPGDLIFTGTPGTTSQILPGDLVEVEIWGIGVLRNPVEQA